MAWVVDEASSSYAASTSSPPPRSWTYHVFLSFRGEDTRKGFTDHLCASLERKGITTFRDDKRLEKGEVISVELMKAIEESMFAIVVFSPNYASSGWCLDELQKIVECKHNLGLYVVPVFYGVEPSDVRYQKGSFEESFRKHEERFGHDSERITRWRDALTQVAGYSGWDSMDKLEATLVDSIAEHIHKKLIPKLPSFTENLVGISSRVEEVVKLMGLGLNDVRFVGIWGMGGIGKTTIARAVYEAVQGEFKVSCFLANVREVCETNRLNGLVQLQKELVAHMNMSTFYNVYDGKKTIGNSLSNHKVLLVLDDVSDEKQLENLADKKWFGPGSRIIITTRNMHLLKIHEVHDTYEVRGLVQNEAFDLFCLKAFKRQKPEERYLYLSREMVEYSGGLPLALEVLGSYLYGRTDVGVWHSAIKKLKSTPHVKILDTLKISYEGLEFSQRNIFLDIACFFKGMKRDYVIGILEKCGHNPQIEIDDLINRSLVTLKEKMLDMHDLLQEMGRNIVIEESPNDPGKRSRLWSKEDIDLVLTKDKGTETIQGIVLEPGYEARFSSGAFSNMSQLKFLSLYGNELPFDHLNYLPSSLKVLHWESCPLKALPPIDQEYEIVEIELKHSRIEQLWHGKKFLENLKHLNLSFSSKLKQTPDLSVVPILETLILESCLELVEAHLSLVHHKKLVRLDLSNCSRLEALPGELEMNSLKELTLSKCFSFANLPEFGESMKNLSRLSLEETPIRELPTSLGCLVGLEYLNLNKCKSLARLPNSIHGLKSLRNLHAIGCSNLFRMPMVISGIEFRSPPLVSGLHLSSLDLSYCHLTEASFPRDFCQWPSLIDLNLSGNDFVRVPMSLHELPKLGYLRLNDCRKLQILPALPSCMRELQAWNCLSLNTSECNTSSMARSFFMSASQDRGEILQMVIPGWEVPSWFVHRQEGYAVSIPVSHDCPLNERLGIAFCFELEWAAWSRSDFGPLVVHCGDRIITSDLPEFDGPCYHLYFVFLTNGYFSDNVLVRLSFVRDPFFASCCSVSWVRAEDIEDFNENATGRSEENKKKSFFKSVVVMGREIRFRQIR